MNRYSPRQLAESLARVKSFHSPGRVTRVDIAAERDGTCRVTLSDESRDSTLNLTTVVLLTSEETRSWREALHAMGLPANKE